MAVLGFWTLTGTIYDATGRPARFRVHVTLPTSYTDVHGQIVARQVAARNPRTQHGTFTLQLPDNVDAAVRVVVDNGPTLYKVIPARSGDITWEALEASIGDWEAEAGTLPAGYPTVAEVDAMIAAAGGGGGLDTEAVQDVVGGMVIAGDNTTVTYDDTAGTVTVSAAAGGLTTEEIQDVIGSTVVAGTGTTVTYDDGAGTVTIDATGGGGAVAAADITDAGATGIAVIQAATPADARTAIGAGTSNLTLGTTAGTALAGDTTVGTVNSTDAALRDRATHTGVQAISTVTGLQAALDGKAVESHQHVASDVIDLGETVQDVIGSTVVAGTNTTVTYNDVAGTVTIDAAAGGLDTEAVQDVIGSTVVAGTGTTVTYDDTAGTVTIDATGGAGGYTAPPALTLPTAGIETGVTQTTDSVRYGFDSGTSGSPVVYSDTIFTQANPAATGAYTTFVNCTFTGHMTISGSNLTFRHCRFEKGLGVSGARDWVIRDSEFVTTAAKVDDGLHITSDTGQVDRGLVSRSRFYIDGTLPPDVGIHWDAVQIRGARNVDIIGCLMEAPATHSNAYNGFVYMENANGGNQHVRIIGCHMNGAVAYATALDGPDVELTDCVITGPEYGPHYSTGEGAAPSGGLARYRQANTVLVDGGTTTVCPMPYVGTGRPVNDLDNAVPGTVYRLPWNGTAWTHAGVALTARPTTRTDVFMDLFGAPAATADPAWMINGDSRTDVG